MNTLASIAALTAAAALTTVSAPAPAQAADNPTGRPTRYTSMTVQVIISSRGLNLSREAGAESFLQRLKLAAGRVCDARPYGPTVALHKLSPAVLACREKALVEAMAEVSSPVVKRLYAQQHASDAVHLARR